MKFSLGMTVERIDCPSDVKDLTRRHLRLYTSDYECRKVLTQIGYEFLGRDEQTKKGFKPKPSWVITQSWLLHGLVNSPGSFEAGTGEPDWRDVAQ